MIIGHRGRGDVVEEAAVLVIVDDHHGALPVGLSANAR